MANKSHHSDHPTRKALDGKPDGVALQVIRVELEKLWMSPSVAL